MPKTSPRGSNKRNARPPKAGLSLKPFVVAAVGAGAGLFGLTSSSSEPPQRSPAVQQAEEETRELVDERTALHLQKLRDL